MAPAVSVDDHVKFLMVCIKYTDGGRPDFKKVAEECDIVSKDAATKRYERLLKKHNAGGNGDGASSSASAPKASTAKTAGAKGAKGEKGAKKSARKPKAPAAKKRKTAPSDEDGDDLDELLIVKEDTEEAEDEVLVA